MREKRIGTSSGIRPSLDSRRSSIGSRRFLGGFQPPCATRGVASRSAFPAARRSSADMYAAGVTKGSFAGSCFAFVLRILSSPPCHTGVPMSGIGPAVARQRQREPQCQTRCQSKHEPQNQSSTSVASVWTRPTTSDLAQPSTWTREVSPGAANQARNPGLRPHVLRRVMEARLRRIGPTNDEQATPVAKLPSHGLASSPRLEP